jgi:uncharacterized membrane protein
VRNPELSLLGATDQDARVRRAELIISTVLRVGVVTSLVVIVAGSLLTFLHHPEYMSAASDLNRLTRPGAAVPHSLREVVLGILNLHGQSIVAAGLLLLILTPVVRVGVSILAFRAQRDRTYVLITSVVFVLLLLSFVLGRPAG